MNWSRGVLTSCVENEANCVVTVGQKIIFFVFCNCVMLYLYFGVELRLALHNVALAGHLFTFGIDRPNSNYIFGSVFCTLSLGSSKPVHTLPVFSIVITYVFETVPLTVMILR